MSEACVRFILHLEAAVDGEPVTGRPGTTEQSLAIHAWLQSQQRSQQASFHGLTKAIVHTPLVADNVSDPYSARERPPDWVLQLYFSELDLLETSCRDDGAVAGLLAHISQITKRRYKWTQQTMAARSFRVPEANPGLTGDKAGAHCTFLVAYPGPAEDLHLWLRHYIDHHPPIMIRFPNIREAEIFTRVDSPNTLGVECVDLMQRNKVVFDSPAALNDALSSEIRHEMREDGKRFPPYSGGSSHYAMESVARLY